MERSVSRWGRDFDPDRLARLELAMWKAYYRRQPLLRGFDGAERAASQALG